MKLIGVDVGGTFTDLMYGDTESQAVAIHKIPTTPGDPSQGVIQGMVEICERHDVDRASVDHVLHGTTIATNAVLEYKGAVTGMVTTEGYRDILHIGRHQRPQHYSIMQDIPWQHRPLVRRRHRKVVAERLIPPDGAVLIPLDEDAVRRVARELRDAEVEAIAVCFLFSYLNPAHEDRAAAIIKEEYPDCFVTTSSAVSPQFREFERFTTAAMNAFIGPKVRTYMQELEGALAANGFRAELHVMGSNGGVATGAMVSERPVLTLLSGPAAGAALERLSGALPPARLARRAAPRAPATGAGPCPGLAHCAPGPPRRAAAAGPGARSAPVGPAVARAARNAGCHARLVRGSGTRRGHDLPGAAEGLGRVVLARHPVSTRGGLTGLVQIAALERGAAAARRGRRGLGIER